MARRTKIRLTRAESKWRTIVAEWRNSGLSAREFCKTKGLKSHTTLHVWSSKLNKIDAELEANGEFVPPKFLPVEVIEHAKADVLEPETIDVYLACGDVICVPQGCNMQQLSQIVAILRKEWQ